MYIEEKWGNSDEKLMSDEAFSVSFKFIVNEIWNTQSSCWEETNGKTELKYYLISLLE